MKRIDTLHLIARLDDLLIELLRSLEAGDWEKPTLAAQWRVKDVVAHLLDGNIRGIAMSRDGYFGVSPEKADTYGDLVAFLNELNADWVKAARRISPPLLITLLELTGNEYFRHLQTLDPEGEALFAVAWAGESSSKNWFHIAREYTEKWHHQQQIRQALGREEALLDEVFYHPFLETSFRALPHHYREVKAATGTAISIEVGGVDARWWLVKTAEGWKLTEDSRKEVAARIRIPGPVAWRMLTKGIARAEAMASLEISGDRKLGEKMADMLAVMA